MAGVLASRHLTEALRWVVTGGGLGRVSDSWAAGGFGIGCCSMGTETAWC